MATRGDHWSDTWSQNQAFRMNMIGQQPWREHSTTTLQARLLVRTGVLLSRWTRLLVSLWVLGWMLACQTAAQDAAESRLQGETVLARLRDGDLETALAMLGDAADRSPQILEEDSWSAAVGAVHRGLQQLESSERYERLHAWSFPTAQRPQLRTLTALVSTAAPPQEFARLLGERPRPTAFPIATVGPVRGVYSSAWQLIVAAEEAGKLPRLKQELEALANVSPDQSESMLRLVRVASSRGDFSDLATFLAKTAHTTGPPDSRPQPIPAHDLVLLCSSLTLPTLRTVCAESFDQWLSPDRQNLSPALRSLLGRARALALVADRAGELRGFESTRLKHWVASSTETSWLVHEAHLLALGGSTSEALFFRYPLLGTWEFRCEAQLGGRADLDSGLAVNGIQFQLQGAGNEGRGGDEDGQLIYKRYFPYVMTGARPRFHPFDLTVAETQLELRVNRQPLWKESSDRSSSPWLAVRCDSTHSPLFRKLRLQGKPVIPRSVPLFANDRLTGWSRTSKVKHVTSAASSGDNPPVPTQTNKQSPQDSPSVTGELLSQGVLTLLRSKQAPREHWQYSRPLLVGESIDYEFRNDSLPSIHPTFGQLAFLLGADGIRIRWLGIAKDDWVPLPPDHSLVEPLNRRGPRTLDLSANQWHRLRLARTATGLVLSLDDTIVYERPIDWVGDQRFGLLMEQASGVAELRQMTLRGDWPETLPEEVAEHLLETTGPPLNSATERLLNDLFQDDFLAENVREVRQHAAALEPAARLKFLADWIFPGDSHAGVRLSGEFAPTHPSPLGLREHPLQSSTGGELLSPVYDLLDLAGTEQQLPELRARLEAVPLPTDPARLKAYTALLLLIAWEQQDLPAVDTIGRTFFKQINSFRPRELVDQWPETLVVGRIPQHPKIPPVIDELLGIVHTQRVQQWRPDGIHEWHYFIASLAAGRKATGASETPHDWIPVSTYRAAFRGAGAPPMQWRWLPAEAHKVSGHDQDFLFYRWPLTGDFEVTCELSEPSHTPTQVLLAGQYFGPRWNHKELEFGTLRYGVNPVPLDHPMKVTGGWVRYRATVSGRIHRVWLNGRLIHTAIVEEPRDPWLAVRCIGRFAGRVKDLRISGQPTIPRQVALATAESLPGWYGYFHNSLGYAGASWRWLDEPGAQGGILGSRDSAQAGLHTENVIYYQRPLEEGETLDYEFFYQPGQWEVHPAVDRLALMIEPAGIREHWITDGRLETIDIAPDNLSDVPEARRGPATLPLNVEDWNQMSLSLKHGVLRVTLNGVDVYERQLPADRPRMFGLFRYSGETSARVRNLFLRGDWPQTIPASSAQTLADPAVDKLDADLPRLPAVFHHNFARDGLPNDYFRGVRSLEGGESALTPQGLLTRRTTTGNWGAIEATAHFRLHGDFDLEASFENAEFTGNNNTEVSLKVFFAGQPRIDCRTVRKRGGSGIHEAVAGVAYQQPDGKWVYPAQGAHSEESASGRLRLARRGKKCFFLYAQGDSAVFKLFASDDLTAADTLLDGLQLQASSSGVGMTSVVWKSLTIRAERLTWSPENVDVGPRVLQVMRPDGTERRELTTPEALQFSTIGSPKWSPDGKKIGMDMTNAGVAESHVVVIDADGRNLKDLGLGCMPSFSADGKQIAFSSSREGVMLMNVDGSNRRVLEANGWAVQWSPDGRWIAYGQSGNLVVVDAAGRNPRRLLTGAAAERYDMIYWNFGWSHDSRSIAFKGRRASGAGSEIAVVDLAAPHAFTVLVANAASSGMKMTWNADNSAVMFVMPHLPQGGSQLYSVERKSPAAPKPLPTLTMERQFFDADWSVDGKWIASTSQRLPQPIDWMTVDPDRRRVAAP